MDTRAKHVAATMRRWLRDRTAVPSNLAPRPNPAVRLRWLCAGFVFSLLVVMSRVGWIVTFDGQAYREAAHRPIVQTAFVPALRGRILARDGTVLAMDEPTSAVAIHYRWLQSPPDPAWLRSKARSLLTPRQRRDRAWLKQAENQVLAQRDALRRQLLALGVVDAAAWDSRVAAIQNRVERIADSVHRRRLARHEAAERKADKPAANAFAQGAGGYWQAWQRRIVRRLDDANAALPLARMPVAEELAFYQLADGISPAVVAEIEGQPGRYPGVRIETRYRRSYPRGDLAAHVLGHVGRPATPVDSQETALAAEAPAAGLMGIERQYDVILQGTAGRRLTKSSRSGDELEVSWQPPPVAGRDVLLTLDVPLQAQLERLLDDALGSISSNHHDLASDDSFATSGAVVVLDVHTGALLALASAPRFAPQAMSSGAVEQTAPLLTDPRRPLFDRASRMALPPGGVVRPLVAAALLATGSAAPDQTVFCNRRRRGCLATDHGPCNLPQAMAVGCDDYFATLAAELPSELLTTWLRRFGLGAATGLDLPGESDGHVPPARAATASDSVDVAALALGQGQLLITPLQLARAVAALAEGGRFPRPHLALGQGDVEEAAEPRSGDAGGFGPVDESQSALAELDIDPAAVDLVVAAMTATMRRAPQGVQLAGYVESVPCAGVCARAAVDGSRPGHLWFAGWAPVEEPRLALVVALEHSRVTPDELLKLAGGAFDHSARVGLLGPGFVPVRAGPSRRTRSTTAAR